MRIIRRLSAAVVALAASAAIAPPAASAWTAVYEGPEGAEILVVRAEPGEANRLGIQDGPVDESVSLYSAVERFTEYSEYCYNNSTSDTYIICPAPYGVRVELGEGNDSLTVSSGVEEPVTVFGGPGDDQIDGGEERSTLHGEAGNDTLKGYGNDDQLFGGDGNDTLDGYSGADRLDAGSGDDLLHPDGYEAASPDVVDGGPGVDRIESDYSTRLLGDPEPPVSITLGGGADDGRPGEGDDLRGVERVILSKGGRVVGSAAAEYVKLHQVGEPGELVGRGGDDELRGGDGNDTIDGGAGADVLDGGFGDDELTGGPGRDRISADLAGGDCGPMWCKHPHGNDVVEARDGEADSISCGAGTDRVVADAADTVAPDCETVERPGKARADAPRPNGGQGGSNGTAGGPTAKLVVIKAAAARRVASRAHGPLRRPSFRLPGPGPRAAGIANRGERHGPPRLRARSSASRRRRSAASPAGPASASASWRDGHDDVHAAPLETAGRGVRVDRAPRPFLSRSKPGRRRPRHVAAGEAQVADTPRRRGRAGATATGAPWPRPILRRRDQRPRRRLPFRRPAAVAQGRRGAQLGASTSRRERTGTRRS